MKCRVSFHNDAKPQHALLTESERAGGLKNMNTHTYSYAGATVSVSPWRPSQTTTLLCTMRGKLSDSARLKIRLSLLLSWPCMLVGSLNRENRFQLKCNMNFPPELHLSQQKEKDFSTNNDCCRFFNPGHHRIM